MKEDLRFVKLVTGYHVQQDNLQKNLAMEQITIAMAELMKNLSVYATKKT